MFKYVTSSGSTIRKPFNKIWIILTVLVLLILFFWQFITFDPRYIRLSELPILLEKIFTPKAGRTWGDYFLYMLQLREPLMDTLKMSLAGTVIGSFAAIPLAILSARNIFKSRFVYMPARLIMNLIRTIPVMILALVAVFFVGIGVLSGILAIILFTFGIMSKMLYEIIETVDMSSYEALESTGANKMQAFRYSVVPQILPVFISYLIYVFEINVRSSAILGYVGAGGIGSVIKDNILYNYDRVGGAIIVMLITILIVQFLSNYVRGKLQ